MKWILAGWGTLRHDLGLIGAAFVLLLYGALVIGAYQRYGMGLAVAAAVYLLVVLVILGVPQPDEADENALYLDALERERERYQSRADDYGARIDQFRESLGQNHKGHDL